MSSPTVLIEESTEALTDRVAERIAARASEAIAAHGRFTWVLSGGATPRALYTLLAGAPRFRSAVDWQRVHFFWGDERHVRPDAPQSNYRMANDAMLSRLSIPAGHVHRIAGELATAEASALAYDEDLAQFFDLKAGSFPRFDFVLLGMGSDGHTASLFPGTPALAEARRRVLAPWVEKLKEFRVTLSAPVFNAAAAVLFLVAGSEKARTVRTALEGSRALNGLPCQLIQPEDGELVWALDAGAASLLTGRR